jgi:integrase
VTYDKQKLTELAKQWAEKWYQEVLKYDLESTDLHWKELEAHELALQEQIVDARGSYSVNDYSMVAETAKGILGAEIDEKSLEYRRLCQHLLQHSIKIDQLLLDKKRKGAELPDTLFETERSEQDNLTMPLNKQTSMPLSDVLDKYAEEKMQTGEWSRKRSESENRLAIGMLIEIVGDVPMGSLTKEHGRRFKEILLAYPAHRSKRTPLKDMTLAEILASPLEFETISLQTASNRFIKVGSFLKWAVGNGFLTVNPLQDMAIKVKGDKKNAKQPFGLDDLRLLFSQEVYTTGKHLHDYYYWVPLIAVFTGMRIEEICQLNLVDFVRIDDVDCFNVTDKGEGQQLKNQSSRRLVPVHPRLVELGIQGYVCARKEQGATMLLPNLNKRSEKYSHDVSKWFGRFKSRVGITDSSKTFHSFRHSVIDRLRATQAPDYAIKEIVGHSDSSTTHAVYGSKNPVPLAATVAAIDYGDALSHVKPFMIK